MLTRPPERSKFESHFLVLQAHKARRHLPLLDGQSCFLILRTGEGRPEQKRKLLIGLFRYRPDSLIAKIEVYWNIHFDGSVANTSER